ncbi:hypothetical protein OCK74_07585 [Chitinophagaceae bacterium LB-8]|uniref:Uncharacterized protein n=1 Tax=Paraflavisolibacter caeni TaxID=2982496 RepID=A0A9X2XWF9_9BACT|nr:hypothetical protein [Paraflavisolibacter caeni]MCU7548973.1 hypothetical protein [Paraflavisolibacter caeni]
MKLFKKILSKFNGLQYNQEYLCLAKEKLVSPLHVYIIKNNLVLDDITSDHLFVGYSPLIFALPDKKELDTHITVCLTAKPQLPNTSIRKKEVIAQLVLQKKYRQCCEGITILYYVGLNGRHQFLSPLQQSINDIYNLLYNQRKDNVFLNSNLYKQVQIAYSLPRVISLITVGNTIQLFNLFPTDLQGPFEDHYLISLRHEGKACAQVEDAKRILLCNVDASCFSYVYQLGKNHMQPLKEKSSFLFSKVESITFNLPIPQHALKYQELELKDAFICGIHKILLFKVIHVETLNNSPSTLAHIHNYYATWRKTKQLEGNYLFR